MPITLPVAAAGAGAAPVPVRPIASASRAPRTATGSLLQAMRSSLLRMLDQIALTLALVATVISEYAATNQASIAGFLSLRVSFRNLLAECVFLVGWRVVFWMTGLYSRLLKGFGSVLWRVPMAVLPCALLLIPALLLHHTEHETFRPMAVFWCTGTLLMLLSRLVIYTYDELVRPLMRRRRSVVICGTGLRARALALELATHPDYNYMLMGFVDSDPQSACDRLAPLLGGVEEMERVLMRLPVDEVMVALPVRSHFSTIEEIIAICSRAGVQAQYSLDIFSTDIVKHRVLDPHEGNRVVLQMVNQDHRLFLKGFVDRVLAGFGLFLLSPALLVIALIVKLSSPGPVFFVQQRYGLNKRMFGMVKFRSMAMDAEARQA